MKNIKNTVAAMGLMAVLGLGSMTANAGILVSDRSAIPNQAACSGGTGMMDQITGILIVGLAGAKGGLMLSDRTGLMLSDRTGLMLSDRATPCVQNGVEGQNGDGILIVG